MHEFNSSRLQYIDFQLMPSRPRSTCQTSVSDLPLRTVDAELLICCAFRQSIGRAVTIVVVVDRTADGRIAGRTFGCRPAVVRTGNAVIDFFPGGLANIIDEEPGVPG